MIELEGKKMCKHHRFHVHLIWEDNETQVNTSNKVHIYVLKDFLCWISSHLSFKLGTF